MAALTARQKAKLMIRKRLFEASFVVATLVASTAGASEQTVTILHTNDMHGRHAPFDAAPGNATAQTGDPGRPPANFSRAGRIGGLASIAGVVEQVRAEKGPENVLLLDAGDTFGDDYVANATKGSAMIELMNKIGYDFMALGNHDFDYGFERTAELQEIAKFPMRGANVLRDGEAVFGEPYKIFSMGGARIAVLALSYHNSGETGSKKNTAALDFTDGIETTRRYLPELRSKADVIVLLSHQGTAVDRKLAREVEGVDLIVGGHSHDIIAPPERIGKTWVVQALSDAAMLGRLDLTLDGTRLTKVDGQVIELWNDQVPAAPTIADAVAKIDAPYRAQLDEVIATSADRIGRQYKSESPFDALVGSIMREAGDAEIAFMPGVGYGVSIEPGPVTRDRLYTLLPHPSKFVTLTMTGAQVLRVLEQSATNLNPSNDLDRVGGLVQTSGIAWTLDLNKPTGQRVSDVTVGGSPLDPEKRYKVATNAGMLGGLHRYDFASGSDVVKHDESVTDVVEAGLRKRGTIVAPEMGNVRLVPLVMD